MLEVCLTRGYFRSARRLVAQGSSAEAKLAATLRSLKTEPVPADGDEQDLLPPGLACWARKVEGTTLAVLFTRKDDVVRVLAVRSSYL